MPENDAQAYEYFKKAREQQALSISDIANALHLNVTLIEQMEAGDFSNRRFAPVFMRGYIRSYAKYLRLSDEMTQQIVNALDTAQPLSSQKLPLTPKKPAATPRIKKIIAYIGVVIALIILASFWHSLHQAPPVTANAPTSTVSTETINEPTDQPIEDETATTTEPDAALPTDLTPQPEEETPAATEPENPPLIATPAPMVKAPIKKVAAPHRDTTPISPEVVDAQETA
jgi:cytoskeleton protein RodZ